MRTPHRLPTVVWKGKEWTVDERLQEFRFFLLGEMPQFISFDSDEGFELLLAYWKSHAVQEGEFEGQ